MKKQNKNTKIVRPFYGLFKWLSGLKPFYGKQSQIHFVHGSVGYASASPGVARQSTARNGKVKLNIGNKI
jgi:hypothetical protein